jgi:hypothetical protein
MKHTRSRAQARSPVTSYKNYPAVHGQRGVVVQTRGSDVAARSTSALERSAQTISLPGQSARYHFAVFAFWVVMMATAAMMMADAISVRVVIDSSRISQPRKTATTGLT